MKMHLSILLAVSLLCGGAAAQYQVVASETFDYGLGGLGGLVGGSGWAGSWWSGGGMNDAVITTPGMDPVGNQATTNFDNAGSYRKPDASGWGNLVFGGRFGTDGSTMWIKFRCRRSAGGDDQYGGLSLNEQFVGEKLYLGAPWQAFEWGLADVATGVSLSAPGTNIDVATGLVYRIDYLPGQDRVRCWVDPLEAYPHANPALDTMVTDHLWDEIRLQSGGGSTHGFDFDGLLIEIKAGEFTVDVDTISAAAGGVVTLTTSVGPIYAGNTFAVGGSMSGTSPGIPFGAVTVPLVQDAYFDLTTMNFNMLPFSNTLGTLDANGEATSLIILPPGVAASFVGQTAHHAAAVLDSSLTLVHATNPAPTLVVN